MKTSSAKNKGRRLQKYVVDKILDTFPWLTSRDVKSTSMGKSGEDVELSEAASKVFPFSVEAKNVEKLNIWQAIEQAEGNNRELIPLVVFKRNRSDVYCTLKLDDLMNLLKEKTEEQSD